MIPDPPEIKDQLSHTRQQGHISHQSINQSILYLLEQVKKTRLNEQYWIGRQKADVDLLIIVK